jgi:hypothetical protein
MQGPGLVVLWLKNDAHQWDHPDGGSVSDATVSLTPPSGSWCGAWWDTATGLPRDLVTFTAGTGPVALGAPPFAGDIALRAARC